MEKGYIFKVLNNIATTNTFKKYSVSHTAYRVYITLLAIKNSQRWTDKPISVSYRGLADMTDMDKNTVQKSIKELCTKGFIFCTNTNSTLKTAVTINFDKLNKETEAIPEGKNNNKKTEKEELIEFVANEATVTETNECYIVKTSNQFIATAVLRKKLSKRVKVETV